MKMYIAVEGCCHGELDKIYETIKYIEAKENITVDILLCCGDFQSVRNEADLACMAVPDKYKSMQDFWKYYNSDKKAPLLTIFIGGNHEASNHLQELPYGGWVAPSIYYLGYAGVVTYKGLRIGGLSGIYKRHDYYKSHHETPPYNNNTKRSVYHIRNADVKKLKQIKSHVDILMSHDWPNGIVDHGNKEKLLRVKQYFREDIENGRLGSDPAWELLNELKPSYWFSGHLHVKFAAVVNHKVGEGEEPKSTRFLSLDKCLPRRNFLQILDVPVKDDDNEKYLKYDKEWLSILVSSNQMFSTKSQTPEEMENDIKNIINKFGDLKIPENFVPNPSCLYDPDNHNKYKPVVLNKNSQTVEFCEKLEISDPMTFANSADDSLSENSSMLSFSDYSVNNSTVLTNNSINEEEINIDSESDDDNPKTESSKTSDSFDEDLPLSNKNIRLGIAQSLPPAIKNTSTPSKCGSQGSSDGLSSLPFSPMSASSESTGCYKSDNEAMQIQTSFETPPMKGAQNAFLMSLKTKKSFSDPESAPKIDDTPTTSTPGKRVFKRRNEAIYTSQSDDD